jgi:hypothetical protein
MFSLMKQKLRVHKTSRVREWHLSERTILNDGLQSVRLLHHELLDVQYISMGLCLTNMQRQQFMNTSRS